MLGEFANQRLVAVAVNLHLLQRPDQALIALEDHLLPAAGPPFKHPSIFIEPLDEDLIGVAEHLGALFIADLILQIHQPLEPFELDRFGDVVFPAHRGGPFAGAVSEDKGQRVADLFQDVIGLLEFGLGFRGEAHDDVGAERYIRDDLSQKGHLFQILLFRVDPVHFFQNAARACLDREVDKFAKRGEIADRLHQLFGDVDRVGGHEADPLHTGDPVQFMQKVVEKAVPFGLVLAVAIDVLPEEGDLLIAGVNEFFTLLDDALWGAGDLLAPGVGDDAVGAELIAAPDDRDKSLHFIVPFGH